MYPLTLSYHNYIQPAPLGLTVPSFVSSSANSTIHSQPRLGSRHLPLSASILSITVAQTTSPLSLSHSLFNAWYPTIQLGIACLKLLLGTYLGTYPYTDLYRTDRRGLTVCRSWRSSYPDHPDLCYLDCAASNNCHSQSHESGPNNHNTLFFFLCRQPPSAVVVEDIRSFVSIPIFDGNIQPMWSR